MTLCGAVKQLVELRDNELMPVFFKPALSKAIETICDSLELEQNEIKPAMGEHKLTKPNT